MPFDAQAPCLCCGDMVLICSKDWSPKKAILCMFCYNSLPLRVIRALFSLRCQVSAMYQQLQQIQTYLSSEG